MIDGLDTLGRLLEANGPEIDTETGGRVAEEIDSDGRLLEEIDSGGRLLEETDVNGRLVAGKLTEDSESVENPLNCTLVEGSETERLKDGKLFDGKLFDGDKPVGRVRGSVIDGSETGGSKLAGRLPVIGNETRVDKPGERSPVKDSEIDGSEIVGRLFVIGSDSEGTIDTDREIEGNN